MPAPVRGFIAKLREPIVTNRGLDLLAVYLWLALVWWGLASVVTGIPTMTAASTPTYEFFWGLTIGALSLIAAAAGGSTFFTIPGVHRTTKRWVELSALLLLICAISVYPALLILGSLDGATRTTATIGLAVYMMGFPVWRSIHLFSCIRVLRITGDSDLNG